MKGIIWLTVLVAGVLFGLSVLFSSEPETPATRWSLQDQLRQEIEGEDQSWGGPG